MAHIFVSYSRKDIDFARYLRAMLENADFTVWMDEKRLSAGMNWSDELESAIDSCGAFVIVMSPDSQQSKFVQSEILHAIDRNKAIFPVLLVAEPFFLLKAYQYEDMRSGLSASVSPAFINNLKQAMGIETSPLAQQKIRFEIVQGNALKFPCDMLIMKMAMGSSGLERQVIKRLKEEDSPLELLGRIGDYQIVDTDYAIGAKQSLFVGTVQVHKFGYRHSREFANYAMSILAKESPQIEHIVMTIHGVRTRMKLDEAETLFAQIGGIVDAIEAGQAPSGLNRITIIEQDADRVGRLQQATSPFLDEVSYAERIDGDEWAYTFTLNDEIIEPPTAKDNIKPYALAITPDDENLEDIFYYGIQRPTHAMGLLCERVVLGQAEDDKMLEAKLQRIAQASAMICDISQISPMLYLQLGYALGKGVPTILISQTQQANFDAAETIAYQKIWELEERLSQWLKETIH